MCLEVYNTLNTVIIFVGGMMYSVRAALLLKIYKEKHFINIDKINRVYNQKFKDLIGELIYYELPCIECRDILYKRKLRQELDKCRNVYYDLKYSKMPRNIKVNDLSKIFFIDKRLFKYCSFRYNSLDASLRLIIPEYLSRYERIIGNIQTHLITDRLDYKLNYTCSNEILNISRNISSVVTSEIAINTVLSFCEDNQKLEYFMLLSRVFVGKNIDEIRNENVTLKQQIFM